MNQTPEGEGQTLVEHLTELRFRVIRALWAIVIGFMACWSFSEYLLDFIRQPITPYLQDGGLIFLGVMDKFLAHLKVSFLGGVILSCPFWLYQLWKFVAPALYENERKYSLAFIGFGSVLFLSGISFAYYLVYPAAFKFLLMFGGETDKPMITLAEYLSFFVTTTLIFGAAFELPVLIVILGLVGVVDANFLRDKRRYAIVILAIVSAIVTPPDALSMMMLLVPLMILYEISILFVQMLAKRREISGTSTMVTTVEPPSNTVSR